MPSFVIREMRAIWVEETYVVEAANEEEAEEVYYQGDYEYVGHELFDNVEYVDSYIKSITEEENPPFVVHPVPPPEVHVLQEATSHAE